MIIGCTTTQSEKNRPIANPFGYYRKSAAEDGNQPVILRSKKGDRSVEVELPSDHERLSEFIIPVSPAFRESSRAPASSAPDIDDSYKNRSASPTDHEIVRSFSHGTLEDDSKRTEIEQDLNLAATDEDPQSSTSYLAAVDHVKQLYKNARYEAALLEIDDLIKKYQTDPKLYEMRGTLLDHLGRPELAMKSWSQSLRFDPKNEALRRFIDRKQVRSAASMEGGP